MINEPSAVDPVVLLWQMWRGEPDVVLSILMLIGPPESLLSRCKENPISNKYDCEMFRGVWGGKDQVPTFSEGLQDLSQIDHIF